jgi:hypothetical protein
VLLALASCAMLGVRGEPLDLPQLRSASGFLWHDVYGRTDRMPQVRIVQGEALRCRQDNGDPGFNTPIGCRGGYSFVPDVVSVAWVPGWRWSQTALAHEFQHQVHARQLIFDPDHRRPEWQPGGAVDQANARLRERGW